MRITLIVHLHRFAALTPDLNDPRFVDARHADIFENLVVDLALARRLVHHLFRAGDERPECRRLRLLGRIGAESEVDSGICQIGMADKSVIQNS